MQAVWSPRLPDTGRMWAAADSAQEPRLSAPSRTDPPPPSPSSSSVCPLRLTCTASRCGLAWRYPTQGWLTLCLCSHLGNIIGCAGFGPLLLLLLAVASACLKQLRLVTPECMYWWSQLFQLLLVLWPYQTEAAAAGSRPCVRPPAVRCAGLLTQPQCRQRVLNVKQTARCAHSPEEGRHVH
jgi:hypothetical protein